MKGGEYTLELNLSC